MLIEIKAVHNEEYPEKLSRLEAILKDIKKYELTRDAKTYEPIPGAKIDEYRLNRKFMDCYRCNKPAGSDDILFVEIYPIGYAVYSLHRDITKCKPGRYNR